MYRVRFYIAAEAGRLLRLLFIRLRSVPADTGRSVGAMMRGGIVDTRKEE